MAQPSGQASLASGHSGEYFFYAQGSNGVWDAKNSALLSKTGSAAPTTEGGANVVIGDGSTRYALSSKVSLSGSWTLIIKVRRDATGDGIGLGDTDDGSQFISINSGSILARIAGNDFSYSTSTSALATYAFVADSTTLEIYKDGTLGTTYTGLSSPILFDINAILAGYTGAAYSLSGAVEFVHLIPGVAADATQIASLASDPYQVVTVSTVTHSTTGALSAQSSTVSGSAGHTYTPTTHATTGSLVAQQASVLGSSHIGTIVESISLVNPVDYRMHQRNGTNQATITVSGTYVGFPLGIEAQFNGGPWTPLSFGANLFSGALVGSVGQGTLEVRFSNATSVTDSAAYIGVGDIYIVAGQSNQSGRATTFTSPATSAYKSVVYNNSGAWAEHTEASSGSLAFNYPEYEGLTAQGSYFGKLSNLLQSQPVPIAFVPRSIGGTEMLYWAPGGTAYGFLTSAVTAVGGSVRGLLWYQGEGDVGPSTPQATYESRLNAFIDAWWAATASKVFVVKICLSGLTSHANTIRAGQDAVIASNTHVAGSADANVWSSGDVHYISQAEADAVAAEVYAGMVAAFYSPKASITLVNPSNSAQADLSGLRWAWFDEVSPDLFNAPTDQGSAEVTDGSGVLTIPLSNTTRIAGQIGWLIVTDSNGTVGTSHKAFTGPVVVS